MHLDICIYNGRATHFIILLQPDIDIYQFSDSDSDSDSVNIQ